MTPDRVGRQGGAGFSGKPNEPLALVSRRPDAPSAVSRSARRVWGITERVTCGTRYGHGFLEQVIGIVLQKYTVHQETRGARVRAKHAGFGLGGWRWDRVRSVHFGKKYGPLSRHRDDGTLLRFSGLYFLAITMMVPCSGAQLAQP